MRKLMGMTALMLVCCIASIGGLTKAQAEQTSKVRVPQVAAVQCPRHVEAVEFYRSKTWKYQRELAEQKFKSSYNPQRAGCRYTLWVAKKWRNRAKLKRQKAAYIRVASNDWVTATGLANQIFPGTRPWLLECSTGEGGHGKWKWNTQTGITYFLEDYPYKPGGSSGAGGPMQFVKSTFTGHVDEAFDAALKRGFVLHESYRSWYNMIGQAVTAAYMRSHGMSSHWDYRVDYHCK